MGVLIPLGSHSTLLRITAGQLEAMHERGAFSGLPPLELRDGVLCQMSPQHVPHALVKTALYDALRDALRALGSPLRATPEVSLAVADTEVPIPDVIVWDVKRSRGAVPVERVRLVAEVSDTTLADDLGRKALVYAAGNILEYWVVDVNGRVIHQHWQPGPDGYARIAPIPFGQPLQSVAVPGLAIGTAALDG